MPAPDLATCYEYESPIEKAFALMLATNAISVYAPSNSVWATAEWREANPDISSYVFIAEEEFQKQRPRAELFVVAGGATGHLNTSRRFDAFDGSLMIRLVTLPVFQQHRAYRAKIRSLIDLDGLAQDTNLPYHRVNKVMDAGTSHEMQGDDDTMISTINYDLHFIIRPTAYPT